MSMEKEVAEARAAMRRSCQLLLAAGTTPEAIVLGCLEMAFESVNGMDPNRCSPCEDHRVVRAALELAHQRHIHGIR